MHDEETRASELPDAEARASAPREKSTAPPYWSAQQPYRAGASATSGGGLTLSRVLPAAILMMVLLLAFIIVWMLMHRSTSTNAVTTPTSTAASSPTSSSTATSTAGSPAPTSTATGSAAPATSTTTLTSTATAPANGSEAAESSPATAQEKVPALPTSTTSTCQEYSSDGNSTTGDAGSGIYFPTTMDHSSCAYVKDIARQVRSVTADGSSSTRFVLSAYSAKYYDSHPTGDGMVPISCVTDNLLTYCSSTTSATTMWVKN